MAARKANRTVRKYARKTARHTVRKTTHSKSRAKRPSKTAKGKSETFRATKSLSKTLSAARNRGFSNTVDYLLKHLQKEIRSKNKSQAKATYECLTSIVINAPSKVSDEVKNNLFASIDRVGSNGNVGKMRFIDTPQHHCVHGNCQDHRSKTCRAIIVNNRYVGCMNKP